VLKKKHIEQSIIPTKTDNIIAKCDAAVQTANYETSTPILYCSVTDETPTKHSSDRK